MNISVVSRSSDMTGTGREAGVCPRPAATDDRTRRVLAQTAAVMPAWTSLVHCNDELVVYDRAAPAITVSLSAHGGRIEVTRRCWGTVLDRVAVSDSDSDSAAMHVTRLLDSACCPHNLPRVRRRAGSQVRVPVS